MSSAIKVTPETKTPCCGPVWFATVRAGSLPLHRTSQETPAVVVRAQLETELVTKDYAYPISAIPH